MTKDLVLTYFKGNGGIALYQSLTATSKKSKASKIGMTFLFGLLMLLYIWMISSTFLATALMSPKMMFVQAAIVTVMLGIMFSYTSVEEVLIMAKDLTFLTPLPIPKRTLELSRLLILYTEVAFESILVYIPFFVISIIKLRFNVLWYLCALISMMVLPVLAVSFMATLSYIGAKFRIVRRMNIIIVYAISFLTMIFLAKKGMSEDAIQYIVDNYAGIRDVKSSIPFISILTLTTIALSALFLLLSSILSPLKDCYEENAKKDKKEKARSHSIRYSLALRELSIMRSNSAFLSELLMEQIMPVLLLVIYTVMGITGNLMTLFELEEVQRYKGFMILAIIAFFYSLSLVSSTSVSREGKDYFLMKVYPIKAKDRVDAKIIFHMAFTLIFALPILVAFTLLMHIDALFILASILLFIVLVFTVSTVGLFRDFSNPNLEWKVATSAVKQNTNGLIAMLFMLPVLLLAGAIVYSLMKININSSLCAIIVAIPILAIGILFRALTLKKVELILQ